MKPSEILDELIQQKQIEFMQALRQHDDWLAANLRQQIESLHERKLLMDQHVKSSDISPVTT